MAEEQSSVRGGGRNAPRKRPSESVTEAVEKHAVLTDLSNLTLNGIGSAGTGRKRKRKQIEAKTEKAVEREVIFSPVADEPRKSRGASLICQHMRSLEVDVKIRPVSYMEMIQNDVKPAMREILVDWVVEVIDECKFSSETLYLTVNYIDRYLSVHEVTRKKLQLISIGCILVASKNVEVTPPHVEELCYLTDNSCTKEEVLRVEKELLKILEFDMGNPTVKSFLRVFSKPAQDKRVFSGPKFDNLCSYLGEMSLLDYTCVSYLPSLVAASVIFLSRLIIKPKVHPWSLVLQHHTGYAPHELKDCVLRLHYLLLRQGKSAKAVTQKYMKHEFSRVASLDPPSEIPSTYFGASRR